MAASKIKSRRKWKIVPVEPLGGVRVTTKNVKKLDAAPVEIKIERIREFLAASDQLDDEKTWELIKKDNKGVAVYRKIWTGVVNYRIPMVQFALATVPPSWFDIFHSSYSALSDISNGIRNAVVIDKERLVPDMKNIFRAFGFCSFGSVKVIIIGQGPYPWLEEGKPVANGLCFSTDKGVRVENSLRNIYRELERCHDEHGLTPFVPPNHGDLRPWAREGVLLLNSTLTGIGRPRGTKSKIKGEPHVGYWNSFIHQVIRSLTQYHKNLIFMAWGQDAQNTLQNIGIIGKHTILKCAHPSGLAKGARDKIYGSGHFIEANRLLIKNGRNPINWHSIMD